MKRRGVRPLERVTVETPAPPLTPAAIRGAIGSGMPNICVDQAASAQYRSYARGCLRAPAGHSGGSIRVQDAVGSVLIQANQGIKRAVDAALAAKNEHEDLPGTVHRLEALVLDLTKQVQEMRRQQP